MLAVAGSVSNTSGIRMQSPCPPPLSSNPAPPSKFDGGAGLLDKGGGQGDCILMPLVLETLPATASMLKGHLVSRPALGCIDMQVNKVKAGLRTRGGRG